MEATARKQDMPPEGGYGAIRFERIPAKTYFSGRTMILGYLGMTAAAAYVYYLTCKKVHKEDVEARSASFAIHPLLVAERDREYLRQLRRNRDEEACLMKDVEGWEVGTWFGEKIYETTKRLVEPVTIEEFYIHARYSDCALRTELTL